MSYRFLCLFSITAILPIAPLQGAFVLNDGGTHVVNSLVSDFVEVANGVGGTTTTVIFRDPANITGTDPFDDSAFVRQSSRMIVEGGTFTDDVAAYNVAELFVSGGQFNDDLVALNRSTVFVSGGNVVDDVESYGQGQITIRGGTFGEDIEAYGGTIEISGGSFANNGIGNLDSGFGAAAGGEIVFRAQSLLVNGVSVMDGEITDLNGVLSGTWQDGTSFSNIPFTRQLAGTGTISFRAVPEPSSALCLLGVVLPLTYRRRRM